MKYGLLEENTKDQINANAIDFTMALKQITPKKDYSVVVDNSGASVDYKKLRERIYALPTVSPIMLQQ